MTIGASASWTGAPGGWSSYDTGRAGINMMLMLVVATTAVAAGGGRCRCRTVGGEVAAAEIKYDVRVGLNHTTGEIGTLVGAFNVALPAEGATASTVALDLAGVTSIAGGLLAGVRHNGTMNFGMAAE